MNTWSLKCYEHCWRSLRFRYDSICVIGKCCMCFPLRKKAIALIMHQVLVFHGNFISGPKWKVNNSLAFLFASRFYLFLSFSLAKQILNIPPACKANSLQLNKRIIILFFFTIDHNRELMDTQRVFLIFKIMLFPRHNTHTRAHTHTNASSKL